MYITICYILQEFFPMIACLTRPLGPVLWCINDRECTSGGMEELGRTVCREFYPSFWFYDSS